MPNDLPPTRSAIFTAGLPPWVRAWTVVWTAIAMILGISGATAVVASAQPLLTQGGPVQAKAPARAAVLPDEQPPTGCGFASSEPDNGNFAQNICWIDMSSFDQTAATSPAGQTMTIQLTPTYKISFNAKLLNSVDNTAGGLPHQGVVASALPTWYGSALGQVAYRGIPAPIMPALYQTSAELDSNDDATQSGGTIAMTNIVMTGPNGPVNNYGLVAADAESTDPSTPTDREFLSFQSNQPLRQIDRTLGVQNPTVPACDGGLTPMPATYVRCDASTDAAIWAGALVVGATAPTTFEATFGNTDVETSRQGLAFGILVSKVKIDKDLTRVTPGDDFTIGMSTGTFANAADAAASELKSTNTGATDTTASTGWRTLLADVSPTPVTFWEKPTTSATKTANYATSWQCEVNGVATPIQVGGVAQAELAPGDNIFCKVINTPVLVKKSSSPPSGDLVNIGDVVTYTLNFENPGAADAAIDYTDYLADVMDNADITGVQATNGLTATPIGQTIKIGGTLAANTTGTVTYTATVKTLGDKVLNNYLAPGTTAPPTTCDPSTNLCTTHPIPAFELTKTADPASGSTVQAGESITYTVTGTNTGKTALTPATITDDLSAVLNNSAIVANSLTSSVGSTPTVANNTLTWSGDLAVGQSVVLTYKVMVNDGVAAGTVLNNKVTGTAKPPIGPEITPPTVETNHSVPGFTLAKTANPVSGSTVQAGESITYTVTGANTGKTTLDPATITDDLSAVLNNAAIDGPMTATIDGAPAAAPTLSGTTLTWTGVLEAGKSVVLTYKVKIKDGVAAGTVLNNKVAGTAKPPTGPAITPPAVETNHSVPGFTITKSAVPPTTTSVNGNDTITYTVTGSNAGNTALDPVTITDDLTAVLLHSKLQGVPTATIDGQPATAPVVNGNTLTWTGVLPASKSVVLTYAAKVDAGVAGGTVLKNHVTGIAKPPTGPEITPPAVETEHPVTAAPGFAVTKTAAPVSGSTVKAGDTITYTVTGSNTGNTVLDPMVLTDDLSKVLSNALIEGALSATIDGATQAVPTLTGTTLTWSGAVPAGKSVVLTYAVKVNADVAGGTILNNSVTGSATPPGTVTPITTPPVETEHPVTAAPGFAVTKTAAPVSGSTVKAGDTITYTVTGSNTGNTVLDPMVLTDDLSKVLSNALIEGALSATIDGATQAVPTLTGTTLTWSGAVPAGKSVVLTYAVKVNADVAGGTILNNSVTGSATPPGTVTPITTPPVETEHPVTAAPGFAVTKTAAPVSGSTVKAGDTITYTVTGSNTGNTVLDPMVLTDDLSKVLNNALIEGALSATIDGATQAVPTLTGTTLTWSGAVPAGKSVVLTYAVKVNADVAGGTILNNSVTGSATPPGTVTPITTPPVETEHPVTAAPGFAVTKTAAPVSGSTVKAGDTITYTVTGSNTGNTVLDPMVLTDDLSKVLNNAVIDGALSATIDGAAQAVPTLTGTTLTWSGAVPAGKSVVLTYAVKVNADVAGGTILNNSVTGSATPPGTVTPITTPPVETTHPVVAPDIKVEKISNPASGTSVVAGNTITYTLKFTNNGTGDGVVSYFDDLRGLVDDAVFNNDLVAQPDLTATANAALDGFTVSGPIKAGDSRTVTYTATVNADGARGDSKVLNVVIPGTTPPVDPPVTCDPATQICTENPVVSPNLEVVKTANPATGTTVTAGQNIDYTLTFRNTGTASAVVDYTDFLSRVLDDATLVSDQPASSDAALTADQIVNKQFRVHGDLAAGATVTVTYSVKVNAADFVPAGDNKLDNFVVKQDPTTPEVPPTEPPTTTPCVAGDALCTEHPVVSPNLEVVKTANPATGTTVTAGQNIDYTLTFRNTGTASAVVDYTDFLSRVLDDATLVSDQPASSDAALTADQIVNKQFRVHGDLAAGATVTVTYSVKVNAADFVPAGDNKLDNFVVKQDPTTPEVPPTEPPTTTPCVAGDALCTEHPVVGTPAIEVLKSSDPATTTHVKAGDEIKYTLTFKNVGTAAGQIDFFDDLTDVLDDAAIKDAPKTADSTLVVSPITENKFTVTGELAAGATATVTYTVKVNPAIGTETGPGINPGVLTNYLVVGGENPPTECKPGDALCTEHPVDPPTTTTTVPPTTTTTPPVTTEPCVAPTTTSAVSSSTTTTSATPTTSETSTDATSTETTESTSTTVETTTEATTTPEVTVDPCIPTTTTPPVTTDPTTTVPPVTTTVPVTPTIIVPPIVIVPPVVVPPVVVVPTVPGQPNPTTVNPGNPGQPKPTTAPPKGGTINSGGGAGESGVDTTLLVAGGLVLMLGLGTGIVLLMRKRREEGED